VNRLLACLLAAGCTQNATGVMIHVVGIGNVDEIDVVGRWGGSSQRAGTTMGKATPLPLDVLVLMAPVSISARFDVTARLAGDVVGSGSSEPVLVLPHQVSHITVVLGEDGDLGATDDLAMADLADVDLTSTSTDDLSLLSDLLSPSPLPDLAPSDLAKPYCSGASTCPNGGSPPCTGFENAAPDAPFTTLTRTGCTATIDSSRACRGSKSLHVHIPAGDGTSGQLEATVFEQTFVPTSTFYLRAFFYLPASVTNDDHLLQAYQSFSPYESVTLVVAPSGVMQTANSVASNYVGPSAIHFPLGRWVCLEWKIVSDTGSGGSVQLFLDGSEVTDITQTGKATQSSPALNTVSLGLSTTPVSSVGAVDAWIDEVRADTSPIGCAK
jgi:hypothetical protein